MEREKLIEKIKEIERNRYKSERKADDEYYQKTSPHYRDNIRFAQAIKTINAGFDKELSDLLNNLKNI